MTFTGNTKISWRNIKTWKSDIELRHHYAWDDLIGTRGNSNSRSASSEANSRQGSSATSSSATFHASIMENTNRKKPRTLSNDVVELTTMEANNSNRYQMSAGSSSSRMNPMISGSGGSNKIQRTPTPAVDVDSDDEEN